MSSQLLGRLKQEDFKVKNEFKANLDNAVNKTLSPNKIK